MSWFRRTKPNSENRSNSADTTSITTPDERDSRAVSFTWGQSTQWDRRVDQVQRRLQPHISTISAAKLRSLLFPAVPILSDDVSAPNAVGQVAGAPLWPAEWPWPRVTGSSTAGVSGRSMSLVIQLDLAALPREVRRLSGLPATGHLTVFHLVEPMDMGGAIYAACEDWNDPALCHVVIVPAATGTTAAIPGDVPALYRQAHLVAVDDLAVDISALEAHLRDAAADDEAQTIEELAHRSKHRENGLASTNSKVFGFPCPLQGPVAEDCPHEGSWHHGDAAIARRSDSWQLLMQLEEIGPFMWGDAGVYFLMAPADALATGLLTDRTWVSAQMY